MVLCGLMNGLTLTNDLGGHQHILTGLFFLCVGNHRVMDKVLFTNEVAINDGILN